MLLSCTGLEKKSCKRLSGLAFTFIQQALIMLCGIGNDWQYTAFTNFNFQMYADRFIQSPSGSRMKIPINPTGWSMELVKH